MAGDTHSTSDIDLACGMSAMDYVRKFVSHATTPQSVIKMRTQMDAIEERVKLVEESMQVISHKQDMLEMTDILEALKVTRKTTEDILEAMDTIYFIPEDPQPTPSIIEPYQPPPPSSEPTQPTTTTTPFFDFRKITWMTAASTVLLAFHYRHEIRIIGRAVIAGAHLITERWEQRQRQIVREREEQARSIQKDQEEEKEAEQLLDMLVAEERDRQARNAATARFWEQTHAQDMRDIQDFRSPSRGSTVSASSWQTA